MNRGSMKPLAVITGLAMGIIAATTTAAQAAPAGDYSVTAHRGGWIENSNITENSLRALTRAARHGATAVETDVRMTRDHYFLIMHDRSLGRTTNGRGQVALRRRRYINRHVRLNDGQRVPYLSQFLRYAHNYRLNVVVEIKPDSRWTPRLMRALVRVVAAQRMTQRVTFLSFNADLLRMVTAAGSPDQTVWIATSQPTATEVKDEGVSGVALSPSMIADDPNLVPSLTDDGLRVQGRDTDSLSDWQTFANAGVSDVLTDATPERAEWLAKEPAQVS